MWLFHDAAYTAMLGQSADGHTTHRAEDATRLAAFMLSKTTYELGYELGHRRGWVAIPL
jgi:predicted trehalose synthase